VAVDKGDLRFAAAGRGVAGVIGEHPGLGVELSHIDDLGPKSARQERKVHRLLALIVGKGDRFLGGGLCRGVVHRGPTFKKLRAGRSRLRRRGKFWRSHPKLVRLLRLKIPYLAASARRPRVSSRPNAAMIS